MIITKMEEQNYPTRAEALRPEEPKRDAGDKSPDSVHRLDSELNFQMALTNLNHICDVMLPQIEKAIARCESIMKEQDPPIKVNTVPLGAKGTSSVQPKHTVRGENGSAPLQPTTTTQSLNVSILSPQRLRYAWSPLQMQEEMP